ncbi:MAG: polysaccharide deacetylase family protein [Verrucomicrobiota bacterium]|nr:polysaccharide deacetylase family protein [Verrucomicrobiota bacterium]
MIKTTIAKWKDNKQCALMLFFDDSLPSHIINAIPALKKRGLTGTFYINPGAKWFKPFKKEWDEIIPKTEMEYANHTMTHSGIKNLKHADEEIGDCCKYILSVNPPSKTSKLISYATPGGLKKGCWNLSTEEMEEIKKKYHLITRLANRESLIHKKTTEELYSFIDKALESASAQTIPFHGVGGDWLSVPLKVFIPLIDRIAEEKEKIWVAGHIAVHKYETERKTAKIEVLSSTESSIKLKLTSKADKTLYDEPLTLLSTLPANWKRSKIIHNKKTKEIIPKNNQIIYNIIPNCGEIEIIRL